MLFSKDHELAPRNWMVNKHMDVMKYARYMVALDQNLPNAANLIANTCDETEERDIFSLVDAATLPQRMELGLLMSLAHHDREIDLMRTRHIRLVFVDDDESPWSAPYSWYNVVTGKSLVFLNARPPNVWGDLLEKHRVSVKTSTSRDRFAVPRIDRAASCEDG